MPRGTNNSSYDALGRVPTMKADGGPFGERSDYIRYSGALEGECKRFDVGVTCTGAGFDPTKVMTGQRRRISSTRTFRAGGCRGGWRCSSNRGRCRRSESLTYVVGLQKDGTPPLQNHSPRLASVGLIRSHRHQPKGGYGGGRRSQSVCGTGSSPTPKRLP